MLELSIKLCKLTTDKSIAEIWPNIRFSALSKKCPRNEIVDGWNKVVGVTNNWTVFLLKNKMIWVFPPWTICGLHCVNHQENDVNKVTALIRFHCWNTIGKMGAFNFIILLLWY